MPTDAKKQHARAMSVTNASRTLGLRVIHDQGASPFPNNSTQANTRGITTVNPKGISMPPYSAASSMADVTCQETSLLLQPIPPQYPPGTMRRFSLRNRGFTPKGDNLTEVRGSIPKRSIQMNPRGIDGQIPRATTLTSGAGAPQQISIKRRAVSVVRARPQTSDIDHTTANSQRSTRFRTRE